MNSAPASLKTDAPSVDSIGKIVGDVNEFNQLPSSRYSTAVNKYEKTKGLEAVLRLRGSISSTVDSSSPAGGGPTPAPVVSEFQPPSATILYENDTGLEDLHQPLSSRYPTAKKVTEDADTKTLNYTEPPKFNQSAVAPSSSSQASDRTRNAEGAASRGAPVLTDNEQAFLVVSGYCLTRE